MKTDEEMAYKTKQEKLTYALNCLDGWHYKAKTATQPEDAKTVRHNEAKNYAYLWDIIKSIEGDS